MQIQEREPTSCDNFPNLQAAMMNPRSPRKLAAPQRNSYGSRKIAEMQSARRCGTPPRQGISHSQEQHRRRTSVRQRGVHSMVHVLYVSGRRGNVQVVRQAARRAGLPPMIIHRGLLAPQRLTRRYRAAIIELDELSPDQAAQWVATLGRGRPRIPVLVHGPSLALPAVAALHRAGVQVARVLSPRRLLQFFLADAPPRLALIAAHPAPATASAPAGAPSSAPTAAPAPLFTRAAEEGVSALSADRSPKFAGGFFSMNRKPTILYMTFDLANVHAFKDLAKQAGLEVRITPRAFPPYQYRASACQAVVVDLDNLHHLASEWLQALVSGGISNSDTPVLVHGYDLHERDEQLMVDHDVTVVRRLTLQTVKSFLGELAAPAHAHAAPDGPPVVQPHDFQEPVQNQVQDDETDTSSAAAA
jgi:hypothetical protein